MDDVEAALANHSFEHLFIECLGWDRVRAEVLVQSEESPVCLDAVAQKRGFMVFTCPVHRTQLANRRLLRDHQRQLRKLYHEHIIIHYCEIPRKQVWQWVMSVGDNRRTQHREHPFFSNQPPPRLLERIHGLAVTIDEEENTTLVDVLARVRQALLPDNECNLFVKRPWYASQSDRLAMDIKQGKPDAFAAFVEFHMPLARKASRMLIHWFNMDAEDAEQTAMIGLLEAARRFDPERGFQFSTYAGYWIRQACQRYGLEWGLPIRVPMHLFWPCYRLTFRHAQLVATYGEHDAAKHFAIELQIAEISSQKWETFCNARRMDCFTDVANEMHPNLDAAAEDIFGAEVAWETERDDFLHSAVDSLKPRQAFILKMRYGIGQDSRTLQEIADILGITRERVRQIQKKAEERLVRILRRSGYADELTANTLNPINMSASEDQA